MSDIPKKKRLSAFHLNPEHLPIHSDKPQIKVDTDPFKQSGQIINQTQDTDLVSRAAKSTEKLDDVLRLARETREIGNNTTAELSLQGERLRGLDGKLSKVDADISQANSLARKMKKAWYNPFTW